jgi:hypothetical protein
MSIQEALSEFMSQGTTLYHRLRSYGEALSDVELTALREQLHILDMEAGHLQELKEFEPEESSFVFRGRKPQAARQLSRRHHS